ncbi:hypothetical protein [Niallia endozanthoxylica]|uniref:Uncharacterized protein n=1 Tax=Niallia endozanthoxylica TaxID=2036016 RepID=A0A5J5HRN9_9BACI|nr:hypothetical protein [Niallia endozanthoxylica]KAA9023984.1 hypothetical protein F4V44_12705 [Niallia endozanthoxylica]
MKIKIAVCLSIFFLLFSSAWLLQKQEPNHQETTLNEMESDINNLNAVPINVEYSQLNTNVNTGMSNVQWKLSEPFKPREYVRIIEP